MSAHQPSNHGTAATGAENQVASKPPPESCILDKGCYALTNPQLTRFHIARHWVPAVYFKCLGCSQFFSENHKIVDHLRSKCCSKGGGMHIFDAEGKQIHIISSYHSESKELETWEKLFESFTSTDAHSQKPIKVNQQLVHYANYKLTYLSTPTLEDKKTAEPKLIQHLAEIALDWMILGSQEGIHAESEPVAALRCHICETEIKEWTDNNVQLANHIHEKHWTMKLGAIDCQICRSNEKRKAKYQFLAICGHPNLQFRPSGILGKDFDAHTHVQSSHSFLKLAHLDLFLRRFFREHRNEEDSHFQRLKSHFRTYNRFKQYYLATPHDRSGIEEAIVKFFEHRLQEMSLHHWDEYSKSKKDLLSHWNHKPHHHDATNQSPGVVPYTVLNHQVAGSGVQQHLAVRGPPRGRSSSLESSRRIGKHGPHSKSNVSLSGCSSFLLSSSGPLESTDGGDIGSFVVVQGLTSNQQQYTIRSPAGAQSQAPTKEELQMLLGRNALLNLPSQQDLRHAQHSPRGQHSEGSQHSISPQQQQPYHQNQLQSPHHQQPRIHYDDLNLMNSSLVPNIGIGQLSLDQRSNGPQHTMQRPTRSGLSQNPPVYPGDLGSQTFGQQRPSSWHSYPSSLGPSHQQPFESGLDSTSQYSQQQLPYVHNNSPSGGNASHVPHHGIVPLNMGSNISPYHTAGGHHPHFGGFPGDRHLVTQDLTPAGSLEQPSHADFLGLTPQKLDDFLRDFSPHGEGPQH